MNTADTPLPGWPALGFLLVFVASLLISQRASAGLARWVDEEGKKLLVAPRAELNVELTDLDVDENYAGQLSLDLKYRGVRAEELRELQTQYPGYEVQLALLSSAGGIRLEIPSIGLDTTVTPEESPDGPWILREEYLNRSKWRALRKALQELGAGALRVTGSVGASGPRREVLERVQIPRAEICDPLVKAPATVNDFLNRFTELSRRLDAGDYAREPETRAQLKSKALSSCAILPQPREVSSFRDLLSLRLAPNVANAPLEASATKVVHSREIIPLEHATRLKMGESTP